MLPHWDYNTEKNRLRTDSYIPTIPNLASHKSSLLLLLTFAQLLFLGLVENFQEETENIAQLLSNTQKLTTLKLKRPKASQGKCKIRQISIRE